MSEPALSVPALSEFQGGARIPSALKLEKRWAPWVTKWLPKARGGAGKWDKRPGLGKSTARPETWMSFDDAIAEYRRRPGIYAGVGFVTTGQETYVGIDLDHCVEDGAIAPWAVKVVSRMQSYTEFSPSGTGLRIMVKDHTANDWTNHEVGIEVYGGNTSRFLTITGDHVPGTPADVCAPPAGNLAALEKEYARERTNADVIDISMPDILDELLLPSVESLSLPYKAKDFLLEGKFSSPDRSLTLFSTSVALYNAGLSDEEVFSILAQNEFSMGLALEKRHEDYDKALLYLWREDCCKGRIKASANKVTADDFQDETTTEAGNPASPPGKPGRFQVQSVSEFTRPKSAPQWFVKGILPRGELAVIFGASGSGKSFLALDMVGCIARGVEWRGKKVTQSRIVYVVAEGAGGFLNRLDAYAQHHGVEKTELDKYIGVIADAPNLMETADIKDLISALRGFGETDIVVIDTFAQSFQGNENSGEDVTRALGHCRKIHKATGALIVLLHHSGKDASKGVRGWSGMRGAADAQIEIVRAGDNRAAIIDKQKDGAGEKDEYAFRLNTVTIGVDEDGDDITSCVVEHTAAVPRSERKKEIKGKYEKLVLRVLESMADLGDEAVQANVLMEACANQLVLDPDSKSDNRRRNAQRGIEGLQEANLIICEAGLIRLA